MNLKPWTLAVALTSAFAVAQFTTTYRDRDRNLEAVGPGGGSVSYKVNGPTVLVLRGSANERAKIRSKQQGLTITAAQMNAVVHPARDKQTRSQIESLTASGGVNVLKDVVQNGARQSTELTASSATYGEAGKEGRLTLEGNVTIRNVNEARKQTSVVTGSGGIVMLDPDAVGNDALRTATLRGPVKINVVEAPGQPGTAPNNFVASGDRIVFDNTAKPAKVTLSGNVKIAGTGQQDFQTEGATQATILLNERGEMTEYVLSSDTATTTTIRNLGGKR